MVRLQTHEPLSVGSPRRGPRTHETHGIHQRRSPPGKSTSLFSHTLSHTPPELETKQQFHWQDYSDKNYLVALQILRDLKDEGFISAIGLCNFDSIRTDEICTQLGPGVIVSNQVQVRLSLSLSFLIPCSFFLMLSLVVSRTCFIPFNSSLSSIPDHCMGWTTFVGSTALSF